MPADVVKLLNEAANEAIRELVSSGRMAAVGIEPVISTPDEFAKYAAAEVQRSGELLKAAGFQPQ